MKPIEEHKLYLRDRRAWAEYAAPRRAKMLAEASPEERRRIWDATGSEMKAALWALKKRSGE